MKTKTTVKAGAVDSNKLPMSLVSRMQILVDVANTSPLATS